LSLKDRDSALCYRRATTLGMDVGSVYDISALERGFMGKQGRKKETYKLKQFTGSFMIDNILVLKNQIVEESILILHGKSTVRDLKKLALEYELLLLSKKENEKQNVSQQKTE